MFFRWEEMKRLQVAFVSYFYPNVMNTGGSVYASDLCSALTEFADVKAIVPKLHEKDVIERKDVDHVLCDFIDFPFLRSLSFYITSSKFVKLADFDIVHLNGGVGIFPGKLDVVTFHHKTESQDVLGYAGYLMQKTCLKKAKAIITVSEKSKEELASIGIKPKNVFVVHNGVNYKLFTPCLDSQTAKNRLNVKEEKVLLYVGSEGMSTRKNMLLLLKLMRRITAGLLLIVSQRKDKMKFLSLAEELGLSKKIHYECEVSTDMLPYYYAASDFFVYPSLQEGFGLVLLEAISSGKPFVSMDVGIASMLAEKGLGYVTNTEEDFIKKCKLMLKSPLKVGWQGNGFVKNNFSWRECAKKTMEVYERVMMTN